ncbi:MAG: hypothetical protein WC998_04905 [Candidatus Paceibacterota bacterium]|jgi:hypothetical protein
MGKVKEFFDAHCWSARKTEFGIMVGRYNGKAFEDIHFSGTDEYLEWKKKQSSLILEEW